jgi:uroporphyrinogen III methyltransferase/synthase
MAEKGSVILVGAGPGDPGLLTLAGKAAIENADVVLYDRLVGSEILALIPPTAIRIDVGKHKGRHTVPQEEIRQLILCHARAGKTVVRLKGGDPYLFGRGAEELEQVAREGIPFRVIPGVTSALAVPAYAGIPVTHREYASSLHILTGHGKEGNPPDIPYAELARLKGTLVFLMGLAAVDKICSGLILAGLPEDTPAALIENGTCANQRKLLATLATLPERSQAAAIASPALLVVGEVCRLAPVLDWTACLTLQTCQAIPTQTHEAIMASSGTNHHDKTFQNFPGKARPCTHLEA